MADAREKRAQDAKSVAAKSSTRAEQEEKCCSRERQERGNWEGADGNTGIHQFPPLQSDWRICPAATLDDLVHSEAIERLADASSVHGKSVGGDLNEDDRPIKLVHNLLY